MTYMLSHVGPKYDDLVNIYIWTQIPDSISVWENMLNDFFVRKVHKQVGHYRFTYMLSHVGPKYDDLVNIYCCAHWGSPHPSYRGEDIWEAGTLQPMEYPEMLYLLQICQGLLQRNLKWLKSLLKEISLV